MTDLIFFGHEIFSSSRNYHQTPCLEALLEANWPVKAVITKPGDWPILTTAKKASIPCYFIDQSSQLADLVAKHPAKVGIVAAFGFYLPPKLLDCLINVHPSLLPCYRGPSPIEASLLAGDQETGVSLMAIDKELDAGPLYAQTTYQIPDSISKLDLTGALGQLGADLLLNNLDQIVSGQIKPEEQKGVVSQSPRLNKAMGQIDWQLPADQLARQVVAYQDWPGSQTTIRGQGVTLLTVKPIDQNERPVGQVVYDKKSNCLIVNCGQGQLAISRLQPNGRNQMSAKDFYNGFWAAAKI